MFSSCLHRPICLTSKCMHTSLLSLRPPPSGGAVRGFAAAVSCYDVKTTTPHPHPLPPVSLVHALCSLYLDPDLLPPLSQSTCWCPSPFGASERERAKPTLQGLGVNPPPPPNHSQISPPHMRFVHNRLLHKTTCRHVNTQIHSQKNVRTFLVCVWWTSQCCRESCVEIGPDRRVHRVRKHYQTMEQQRWLCSPVV